MNALAFADASHAIRALRVISEHHVLADGDDGASGRALLDVDTGSVDLIEEREPAR